MIIKLILFSLLTTLVNGQEAVKNAVIIRNDDFKKGMTFDQAMAQVYKRIVPKKSTKKATPCFWMLGDGKYLIVHTPLKYWPGEKPLEIEPMLIKKMAKVGKKGEKYLVNKSEQLTLEGFKQSIITYRSLAKANDSEPIFLICRSAVDAKDGISMLRLIREMGITQICLAVPEKIFVAPPVVPLPKRRPVSPHRK
jgi:hypothetical protein